MLQKVFIRLFAHQTRRNIHTCKLSQKNVIFSGIQPTGNIHLGNYLGAIKPWVKLQEIENNQCLFSVVDLHSLTTIPESQKLNSAIKRSLAVLLASGLDPEKSLIFQQSTVVHHTLLSWILGCLTTMARLEKLPQFKEKSATFKNVPLGIYIYPVLQSADILLYKANQVPVGKDQLQHIQVAQHLAGKFNKIYEEVFPVPEPLVYEAHLGSNLKSLRDPTKKMSKSDPDSKSRIEITDSPDMIVNKCKKALTDFISHVEYDPEKRPGVSNLVLMHSVLTGKTFDVICNENQHRNTGEYKLVVADVIIEYLGPIRRMIEDLLKNEDYLESVLIKGRERATNIAVKTVSEVESAIGLKWSK